MDEFQSHGQSPHSGFWEVDGYKRTVKRTEDGLVLCNELMKLMQERAEIEKKYADKIKSWGKKWNEIIDKSPAYGSTREVLKGSLKEAEKLSEAHVIVKDRLNSIVIANVLDWRAENYKKQLIGCKPAKTFEEEFQRAQKPWAKKLEKLNKAKKDYYNACRQHRTAANMEAEARQRTDHTPDQVKKLQDKTEKCHREVESCREKYARLVEELNTMNGKYMEEMTIVFNKTQDFDRKRIDFFKDILHKFVETLDLSKNQMISETYQQFHQTVDELDPDSDLKWWSQNHGIDVPVTWPQFEEFAADTVPDRGSRVTGDNGAVPVGAAMVAGELAASSTLPRSNTYPQSSTWDQRPSETTGTTNRQNSHPMTNNGSTSGQNWYAPQPVNSHSSPFDDESIEDMDSAKTVPVVSAPPPPPASSQQSSNSYGGIQVRALYDYEGQEEDELTFRLGDVFTKLREADDQGWCTGLKDGRVGLFPESYAEPC